MSALPEPRGRLTDFIITVDRNGLLWLTEFRHPILNRAMEILSRAGDWDVWSAIIAALLVAPPQKSPLRRAGRLMMPRIGAAFAFCLVLKLAARRRRPSVGVEGFSSLLTDPDPYSFPSSHAACAWAGCVAAARAVGGAGWCLPFYAALISYSRIHVGAHYPLDVLVGAGVGAIVGGH